MFLWIVPQKECSLEGQRTRHQHLQQEGEEEDKVEEDEEEVMEA